VTDRYEAIYSSLVSTAYRVGWLSLLDIVVWNSLGP
jgi:hypothetical protein